MVAVAEAHAVERPHGLLAPGAPVDAGIDHRQLHIAQRIDPRQQIELLEHEADLAVAQPREPVRIEGFDGGAGEAIRAAGGPVEAAHEVHEGGFAGARGAHHRDELPGLDLERHAGERVTRPESRS
jgi:hypothetical protein